MQGKSKAETFIGFAVRAGKIKCGVNALTLTRERIKVLILCSTAAENSRSESVKLSKKFNCPLVVCYGIKLEQMVHKDNCKLAGIYDNNLAKAVLDNIDGNILKYFGGDNI